MTDTQKILEDFDTEMGTGVFSPASVTSKLYYKKFLITKIAQARAEERERKTVYQCSCCGFRSDGILRIHDCEWTNQLKIGYLTKKD